MSDDPHPFPTLRWFAWGGFDVTPEVIGQINEELAPYNLTLRVALYDENWHLYYHTDPTTKPRCIVAACIPVELATWLCGHAGGSKEHFRNLLFDMERKHRYPWER